MITVNKMNKKGDMGDLLAGNLIYLLIAIVAVAALIIYLGINANGAGVWEDFYTKEVAGKIVNLASIGDEITINVQKASEIALKNGVNKDNIFWFNNNNKEFCAKLRLAGSTCFNYIRNISVEQCEFKIGLAEGAGNTITFNVSENKQAEERVKCKLAR